MTTGDPATVRSARISDDLHLAVLDRGGGRAMRLFSREARDYLYFDGLPSVENASAHLRRHPLTASGSPIRRRDRAGPCFPMRMTVRSARCVTPLASPMCRSRIMRWRFSPTGSPRCCLIPGRRRNWCCRPAAVPGSATSSLHSDHAASLSSIGPDRIALLVDALADRVPQIMENPDIACVLPFENRGREIGVTLDHARADLRSVASAGAYPPDRRRLPRW